MWGGRSTQQRLVQDRGWSLGGGAKGEGSAVREGARAGLGSGGQRNPKFVIAVVAAHLTGVYRTAGAGK